MANDVSLAFNVLGRDRGATSTISRVGHAIRATSALSVAAHVAMGAAMASAAAHAVALTSAVVPAVGAVALLPGAALAAAAGISVLAMAAGGLGDAFKAAGQNAGGGGANIAAAERRIAAAQREALAAQQAINDARKEAQERIEDLTRSLAGARLDEEAAVMAVADAERELAEARRKGNAQDVARADLAYRQSVQTLDEVRDRLGDLTEEQQTAAKKGVQGSDEVQAALERQRAALESLAAAQEALKSGGGGVDKFAEAMAKLSPAGRELVTTIRALMPAWASLRRSVQQTVLSGVAGDIRALSDAYLPVLRVRLNQVGAGWNIAFRQTAGLLRSRSAVADTNTGLANTAVLMNRLGRSVAPLVSGLRHFAVVGSTFLPGIGDWALRISQRFERWAAAARESGRMQEWMSKGVAVLKQLWAIGGNVVGIIRAIFRAGDDGGKTLTSLEQMTAKASAFLNSAEGQTKLAEVFTSLRGILASVGSVIPAVASAFASLGSSGVQGITDTFSVMGTVMGFLADHTDTLAALLPYLVAGFIAVKIAQVGANAAAVAGIPLRVAELIINVKLQRALKANTAATVAEAVAKRGANAATVAGAAAENVATAAKTRGVIATRLATAATWALNIAQRAMPLFLIIGLIMLVVGGIMLLWNKNEGFRKVVLAVWAGIKAAVAAFVDWFVKFVWPWIKFVWDAIAAALVWLWGIYSRYIGFILGVVRGFALWLLNTAWPWIKGVWDRVAGAVVAVWNMYTTIWGNIIRFVTGLPGRIASAASGLWDGIKNSFKSAVNWIISRWNNLSFRIPAINIPGIGQVYGGMTLNLPDIPLLYKGGHVLSGGMAVVGDRGPELVSLTRGATVTPLSGGAGGPEMVHLPAGAKVFPNGTAPGPAQLVLRIDSSGRAVDQFLLQLLRKAIRNAGANSDVQIVLGG